MCVNLLTPQSALHSTTHHEIFLNNRMKYLQSSLLLVSLDALEALAVAELNDKFEFTDTT